MGRGKKWKERVITSYTDLPVGQRAYLHSGTQGQSNYKPQLAVSKRSMTAEIDRLNTNNINTPAAYLGYPDVKEEMRQAIKASVSGKDVL